MSELVAQNFPGNVRQLENLCHWLTVMAATQVIEVADLPPDTRSNGPRKAAADWVEALGNEVEGQLGRGESSIMDQLVRDFEKTLISKALARTGGRRIEAANILGMGRNTITRKIAELDIEGKGEDKDDTHKDDSQDSPATGK